MNDVLLCPIKLNDLELLIENSMKRVLDKNQNHEPARKESDDLLNVKQASEYLKLAIPTIYTLTSKRTLPHSKQGKKLYFSKADLNAWIKSGKRSTVSELKDKAKKL